MFQIELVLKFLQKAALSLREPYYLKAPSAKLSGKDRVRTCGRSLMTSHYMEQRGLSQFSYLFYQKILSLKAIWPLQKMGVLEVALINVTERSQSWSGDVRLRRG